MDLEAMTPYDRAAWHRSLDYLYAPPGRRVLPEKARARVRETTNRAKEWAGDLPGSEHAADIVNKAFEGTLALTFQPALRSVRPERTVQRFARAHPEVASIEDIHLLDLKDCDSMAKPKFGYTVLSAAQGGASAVAVTGAEVATTVSAGTTASVAIGAVAADAVASMAMMGRTIGVVGSRYGYDLRLPGEEVFALGVLSLGAAGSVTAKAQALAALSRLTQQMMRHATWAQLSEHVLVMVISKAYQLLGFRLTQRKLAQAVPIVGIGLNAALTAQLTDQTFRRAEAAYRLRFLSEKYGIDPQKWIRPDAVKALPGASTDNEQVIDVEEILEEEIRKEGVG